MPKTKKPRVAAPGDEMQQYTLDMRERLKGLKLTEEKNAGQERAVSETKVDDLIAKEADDAKINALYTMWFIDKTRDKVKQDTEHPDFGVMRERYNERMRRLDGADAAATPAPPPAPAPLQPRGLVELVAPEDFGEQLDRARAAHAARRERQAQAARAASFALPTDRAAEDDSGDEGIAEFLESVQQQYRRNDRVSKRVVKSPAQRRQDYEDTKFAVTASTAALGAGGTLASLALSGANAAFSFAFGSVGALLYLSGLSQYADSAETPMAQALGGRRLLVPVILVLSVANWEKLCYYAPVLGDSGLQPELVPLLLGFFTYALGKVIGGAFKL